MSMNTLDLVYFSIAVTSLTSIAPADGFIDHQNPEDYGTLPSSGILSDAKERANMRYAAILRYLSENISPITVKDQIATGATQDTEASAFSMIVAYDREEYLSTEDENNPGTVLTGILALTRWIARALIMDQTGNRYFYNPENVGTNLKPQGSIIKSITAGAPAATLVAAEAAITVTQLV